MILVSECCDLTCMVDLFLQGDLWIHSLKVMAVNDVTKGMKRVELLDGAGACPPEDSNGLDGKGNEPYCEFLEAYKKNPRSVSRVVRDIETTAYNYKSHCVTGKPVKFDPFKFDIHMTRVILDATLSGPRILKPAGGFNMQTIESYAKCAACGDRLKPLMACSGCKKENYCSKDCQKKHWKVHKHVCCKK